MTSTDQQMHAVLLELMMLMQGKTQSWNATTKGGDRDPCPSGEAYPIAEEYRDRYHQAAGDIARTRVLHDARDELERWRGHGITRHAGETTAQEEVRMLREGKGFDPQTVAVRFNTSASRVRRVRIQGQHTPETGLPLPGAVAPPSGDLARMVELKGNGYTLRQIATLTGKPRSTVDRMLRDAA